MISKKWRAIVRTLAVGALFSWQPATQAEEAMRTPRRAPLVLFAKIIQDATTPRLAVAVANVSTKSIRIPWFLQEGWAGRCEGAQNLRYQLYDSSGNSVLYGCYVRAGSMKKADFSLLLKPGEVFAQVVSGLSCFEWKEGERYRLILRYVVGCPGDGNPPANAFVGEISMDPIEFTWRPHSAAKGVKVRSPLGCEAAVKEEKKRLDGELRAMGMSPIEVDEQPPRRTDAGTSTDGGR